MPLPHSSRHVPRYDVRRDRRRITWLVLALGLVVIATTEASKPRTWEWLTGPPGHQVRQTTGTSRNAATGASTPDADDPLALDEFRLASPNPRNVADADRPSDQTIEAELRVPRALLETLQDQSIGIRSAERDAYFSILTKSRDVTLDIMERFGRRDVTYAELTNDPERHRGELVILDGELRRFTPMAAGENDHGIEHLYDGWLFTEEAGRKSPYRIICLEKPAGMPEGEQIRERVTFTGYFFKRCSYETSHGLHSAPLLLGRTVRWTPPRPRTDDARGAAPYIVWGLGLLGCGFAGALWWLSSVDRKLRESSVQRIREPSCEELAGLDRVEAKDVSTFLRELSEKREEDKSGEGG